MGFVPFILARNQFMLFSQVNMFEIGCCQASSLCVTGKFQWLHFSSHPPPTLSGPTAPHCSFSGPHTKSLSLKWALIRALRHHQCVPPLGYLALHLGFKHCQACDCRGTHTASSAVAPALSPHCPPGVHWMSTGLLKLKGSKPVTPETIPTGILIHLVI